MLPCQAGLNKNIALAYADFSYADFNSIQAKKQALSITAGAFYLPAVVKIKPSKFKLNKRIFINS